MKYIENLALENLTKLITNCELGGTLLINGRIETYSTKKAGDEKKQSKLIESKFDNAISTNNTINTVCNKNTMINNNVIKPDVSLKTKKVLSDLIQTMNCSMVDYDFSVLTPDSFLQISLNDSIQVINSYLAELTVNNPSFINELWSNISETMINLSQCEVYKLIDNTYIDEVENGIQWSFNYFFCSKEHKRVCYFTCIANNKYRKINLLGYDDDDDDNEDDDDEDDCRDMNTSDGNDDDDDIDNDDDNVIEWD